MSWRISTLMRHVRLHVGVETEPCRCHCTWASQYIPASFTTSLDGTEWAFCDYQRVCLIWFNPAVRTSSTAISGFCFAISAAASFIINLSPPSVFTRQTEEQKWTCSHVLFMPRWCCDLTPMTYVPVLEPGGGTAGPRWGGEAPTLTGATIAFCGGMMENISIRSCI